MTKLRAIRGTTTILSVRIFFPLIETDSLLFVAKLRAGDDPLFTKTSGGGITVEDLGTVDNEANVAVEVLPTDTEDVLQDTVYLWELHVNTAAGRKLPIDEGTLLVKVGVIT